MVDFPSGIGYIYTMWKQAESMEMTEPEKRAWLMLYGLSMAVQGAVLLGTIGYWNTHLYIKVAYLYSNREQRLARQKVS